TFAQSRRPRVRPRPSGRAATSRRRSMPGAHREDFWVAGYPKVFAITGYPATPLAAERSAQAIGVYPPEIVLHAVDQRYWTHVAVVAQVLGRGGDIPFAPRPPEFARNRRDH